MKSEQESSQMKPTAGDRAKNSLMNKLEWVAISPISSCNKKAKASEGQSGALLKPVHVLSCFKQGSLSPSDLASSAPIRLAD